MNTVRSPQPSLTFIVKTTSRLYHLMAPSPEAMRVWVDVVFTGAEGYHEFDHGVWFIFVYKTNFHKRESNFLTWYENIVISGL